ncbi:MAG: hypothetical protein P1V97_32820 [Planctomycetota bacterium]|nr:hypothetical protein [Planctomycetota bacterium]
MTPTTLGQAPQLRIPAGILGPDLGQGWDRRAASVDGKAPAPLTLVPCGQEPLDAQEQARS